MRKLLLGGAALLLVSAAPVVAEEIPEWDINQLCAGNSDKNKCIGAELEARRVLSNRWIAAKPAIKDDCLAGLKTDTDKTFSKLDGCVATKVAAEAAAKKAADEAAAKKAAEEAAAKKAAAEAAAKAEAEKKAAAEAAAKAEADKKAAEEALKKAADQANKPVEAQPAPAPAAPAEAPKEAPK